MYQCPTTFKSASYNLYNNLTCSMADSNDWVTVLNTQCTKPVLIWTKGNFLVSITMKF